jgi:hypothetical protein
VAAVPSGGGAIATVRVQSTVAVALFQVGHIKAVNFANTCGANAVGYMVERKSPSGSYLCNAFFGSFGSSHQFTARHNGSGWSALVDGVVFDGPYVLGTFTAGNAYAVGEYNGNAPSGYSMTFGSGTKWGYKTGSTWTVITSSATFNGGGWSVGALPSPFAISR